MGTCVHMCTASDRRPDAIGRTTDQTANSPAKSRGTDATSSPSGNESGNLRRQRVRAVWPLRVEEQCGACLTRRGNRADTSLPSRNEPQHKNFDSNTDKHPNRCSSPMFSKETPCKLFNSAISYSVKPVNVPSESAKPVWLGVASERVRSERQPNPGQARCNPLRACNRYAVRQTRDGVRVRDEPASVVDCPRD